MVTADLGATHAVGASGPPVAGNPAVTSAPVPFDDSVSLQHTTLDEGLTVVTERMPDVRSVSIGFWVGTGSVDEAPGQAGASHFLEHLLFKGTATRSARSIAEDVDAVGGDMNAFTTKEYTAFYVRLLAEDQTLGLDILSDIIWSPAFRPAEFESERQVILEEILMHADEPADLVHDVLAGALYPEHPLGREVLGEQGTVEAMGVDDVARFHAAHYRPANMVVAAAGLLDHDQIVDGLTKRLRGRDGGAAPARVAPSLPALSRMVLARPTEQVHLAVAVPAPDRDDDERHAMSIIDHVLGGGMSSRLFQSIREERGLAYSVYSYRLAFQGAGALAIYAGTAPAHAAQVRDLILEEFDNIVAKGVTAEELEKARSHLRGSIALGLEDSGARMSRLGHSQIAHGRVLTLDEVDARLAALDLDHVNDVGARWLSRTRTLACVGPFDLDADGLEAAG